MNIQEATPTELTAEERAVLEGMVRSPKTEQRLAKRAPVVLLAADRMPTRQIARLVGFSIGKASQWRGRFFRDPPGGLVGKTRAGVGTDDTSGNRPRPPHPPDETAPPRARPCDAPPACAGG